MTKIVRLESTNYKRLKAVEIAPDPDGNLVIVAGKNGQGKTSILDSITAALGGVNAKTTPKPIREGEERAEIILETEDLVINRRFTASGSTLVVKSPDGAVYPKGQSKLDDMLGRLSLDPLAFTQLSERDQLATLLDLVELPFDPDKLATARKELFERRTDANRNLKSAKAAADGYPVTPEMADLKHVSVNDLLTQIEAAQALERDYNADQREHAQAAAYVERLKDDLLDAEASLGEAKARLGAWDEVDVPDVSALREQVRSAEQINEDVRRFGLWVTANDVYTQRQAEAAELTAKLEAIDRKKEDGLASAKFPIEGLGFDDSGVIYNGVPFKQASSAEQLRVSLAMAIALNPKLRVIRIADGSLLDSDNLALVESIAREHDFQIWIEMVGDGDGRGIIIEDGQVVV